MGDVEGTALVFVQDLALSKRAVGVPVTSSVV
jgi:hypothetical protein